MIYFETLRIDYILTLFKENLTKF